MKILKLNNKGFTLVELMVAVVILGLVLMAISTTFIGQRRSGLTQDDVAESQQSARIGLESIVRDIRKAGIMLPKPPAADSNPVEEAGQFAITVLVGSEMDGYATILNPADEDGNITGLNSPITFTVDTTRDFQGRVGASAQIIRPSDGMEPSKSDGANNVCYSVAAITPQGVAPATVTLTLLAAAALPPGGIPDIKFKPGDTIMLHDCFTPTPWPVRIRYSIDPDPGLAPGTTTLRRLLRNGEVVAQNIIVPDADADGIPDDRNGNGLPDVVFRYYDRSGNETAALENITSVSIDLTTATTKDVAQLDNQARTRELTSMVRIKNKFD